MPTPDPSTYPPLDTLKPVADDVWIVDSGPLRVFGGIPLPVRMAVVRLRGGDLLLYSPTRYDEGLRRELAEIGRVRHLVAPNVAHWMFVKQWQGMCPDATTWAAPGLRGRGQVRRSGVRIDRELGETPPPDWAGQIEQVVVRGGAGFVEVDLFHTATRTLLLTDLVVNLEAEKLPRPLRPFVRLFGMAAPDGEPPPYLRAVIKLRRREATQAAARLLAWGPDRVVFTHGAWFERDGTAALRRSLRWLLA